MSSRQSYARQRASPRFRKVEKMLDKIINLSRHIEEEEKKKQDTRVRIRKRSMVIPNSEVALTT